jgi:hypothetical protein
VLMIWSQRTSSTCTCAPPPRWWVSEAVVVATGVTADGRREILGLDIGDRDDEVFWRVFLLSLKKRGLGGDVTDQAQHARVYLVTVSVHA